jgi:hypothetical protein
MATAHYVICPYCGEKFNRDKEPTTQVSARRYAHKKCAEEHEKNKSQEEKDLEALEKYIKNLFDEEYVNARVRKQLKEYKEQYNFTYSGILKTLIYWYEVKGNSIEKANGGLGIVPYVYQQACQYYYALYLAKLANENKDIQNYHTKVKEVEIPPPQPKLFKIKLFNLGEEEDNV